MDQFKIKEQLNEWLINFVEKPNPLLNNWAPCPYARQARINDKISFKFCQVSEFTNVLRESLSLLHW